MKNKLLIVFILHFAFCILNSEFTQAANYYWVGGTGNWSNYAVHWATTSGGNVFHVQVPTSFDNVYFDANSFTAPGQIVTNDTTIAYCRDMDWTGATNFPVFEAANSSIELKIFGSLTLNPVVNFSFNGRLTFTSFNPGKTIQTFSEILQCPIEFNGAGGEWTLLDSLTTVQTCSLTYGTLRTNNNNLRCNSFYSYNSNARSFYLGTSTVWITDDNYGKWFVNASLVIDADSSIIRLRDGGRFYAESHTYNIIHWDSTDFGSPDNRLEQSNLVINKVICHNSWQYSILNIDCGDCFVDSIFAQGSLEAQNASSFYNYVFVNHDAHLEGYYPDSIMKMTVNEDVTFGYGSCNANNYVHDLTVHGDLKIFQTHPGCNNETNSQTFDSCYVGGNATILSGSNNLGVFTMTPGKTLTLKNDSTQYIDSLSATGNPGFPIQIISSDLGLAANVSIQEDLCTNYLYIHAVHATSPNSLYVGVNSNDVANNSGWIFTNCIVGMEENHENALLLFPNPTTGEFKIKNSELRIELVEIYNAIGENVFSQQPEANSQQLIVNVSSLTPGIYFIKVKNQNGESVARFVKE